MFPYLLHLNYLWTYFPVKIVNTANLDPDKNYIFGCHPHGVITSSGFGSFINPFSDFKKILPNSKIYFATINIHFKTTFYREYVLGIGMFLVQ